MVNEKQLLEQLTRLENLIIDTNKRIDAVQHNSADSAVYSVTHIPETQDALCETSIDVDERITTIEDALCELSKEG